MGAKAATLTVSSSAADVAIALSGTGIQTALSRDPGSLAFGSQDVDDGPTDVQASTITNTGTEAVTLSGLTLTGNAAAFERLTGDAEDCTSTTALGADQSCVVRLRFDPSSIGAK